MRRRANDLPSSVRGRAVRLGIKAVGGGGGGSVVRPTVKDIADAIDPHCVSFRSAAAAPDR